MKKNKSGFTLIELLVVIAIIGLLSALSILSLNTARARARDAKRVADVNQIRTALEMYYNDLNLYPPASAVATTGPIMNGTSSIFLSVLPVPPTPIDGTCTVPAPLYTYTQDASGASYHINYCLGSASGVIPAGNNVATPAGMK